jgi:hypothetical protein
LGLGRFRDKYVAKMATTPDAHAFEIASAPLGASSAEFAAVAHAAAAGDTLDGFLRDMQARYPDMSDAPAVSSGAPAAAPPADVLSPVPPPRAAGRTALR